MNRIIDFFLSLKLTVVLLALSMVLVFAGTLAQVDKGIWTVMDQYFRCYVAMIDLPVLFPRSWDIPNIRVPFPGGFLIGILLTINLLTVHMASFRILVNGGRRTAGIAVLLLGILVVVGVMLGWGTTPVAATDNDAFWRVFLRLGRGTLAAVVLYIGCLLLYRQRAGMVLLHAGILFLLVGEFITAQFAVEANLTMKEGETVNFLDRSQRLELSFTETSNSDRDIVTVVPERLLRKADISSRLSAEEQKNKIARLFLIGGAIAGVVVLIIIGACFLERLKACHFNAWGVLGGIAAGFVFILVMGFGGRILVGMVPIHHFHSPVPSINPGGLPFEIRVNRYMVNSNNPRPLQNVPEAQRANYPKYEGYGSRLYVAEQREVSGTGGARDAPSVDVELLDRETGASLGRYILSLWFYPNFVNRAWDMPTIFSVGGKTYTAYFRYEREYLRSPSGSPYTIKLLDFKHEKYEGTQMPKDFSSRIQLVNPGDDIDRELRIWMNNPLRYARRTFYQSGYLPDDSGTVLQVVRNDVWMIPYLSCMIVFVGMAAQFVQSFKRYLRRDA